MTKENFCKNLHILIKERQPKVIKEMIPLLTDLFKSKDPALENINLSKFMGTYTEHFLSNARKLQKQALGLIVPIQEWQETDSFMEEMKGLFNTIKMKVQEQALNIVLELVDQGKIQELGYLKKLWKPIAKLTNSRTAKIRKKAMDVYKESYLWMGPQMKVFTGDLKDKEKKDFEKYMGEVTPEQMKVVKSKKGGKQAKVPDL